MTNECTPVRLERTFDAPAGLVWELLTSAAGIEEWWAPDGFETRVDEIELRPGGHVRYTMTATSPEQVAFVRDLGMPLSNEFCRTYTEVQAPTRLAYRSVIDFVPDQAPYEHLTRIEITPAGERSTVVVILEALHDESWTEEYRKHRDAELDNLEEALGRALRGEGGR
jgi:uncharacterized protein YndB with AHSA1/START domain